MNKGIEIIGLLIGTAVDAIEDIKERITDIKYVPIGENDTEDCISFKIDGVNHTGALKGRNTGLCLGWGIEKDKVIVCRVILDGDSTCTTKK